FEEYVPLDPGRDWRVLGQLTVGDQLPLGPDLRESRVPPPLSGLDIGQRGARRNDVGDAPRLLRGVQRLEGRGARRRRVAQCMSDLALNSPQDPQPGGVTRDREDGAATRDMPL